MNNKFIWILPSGFMAEEIGPYEFDLFKSLRILIKNEFWNRKVNYEKRYFFSKESFKNIVSAKIKIFPRTKSYFFIKDEHKRIFEKNIQVINEDVQYIYDRGNLRVCKSLSFIEIEFESKTQISKNILRINENDPENFYTDMDFEKLYEGLISISNELISLFLTGIHIIFPTRDTFFESHKPQTGGIVLVKDETISFYRDEHSNVLTHPILLEVEKIKLVDEVINVISSIWHKDLWTVHRFLKALRSDYIDIDNLLDLVFALESFFVKNTSTEFMRIAANVIGSNSIAESNKADLLLRTVFSLRNEVVHGGKYYRIMKKSLCSEVSKG